MGGYVVKQLDNRLVGESGRSCLLGANYTEGHYERVVSNAIVIEERTNDLLKVCDTRIIEGF